MTMHYMRLLKAILNNEEDVRFNTYGPLHLFFHIYLKINFPK